MDSRACRLVDEGKCNEARCRDVQVGSFRLVVASQCLGSFGAGHRQRPLPKGTLGLPVSLIWAQALCQEGHCRIHHALDG